VLDIDDSTPIVRSWKNDRESIAAETTTMGLLSVEVILIEGVAHTDAPPMGVHHPINATIKRIHLVRGSVLLCNMHPDYPT
jgi:hypothetical protein